MSYTVKVSGSLKDFGLWDFETQFTDSVLATKQWDEQKAKLIKSEDFYAEKNSDYLVVVKHRETEVAVKLEFLTFGLCLSTISNYSDELVEETAELVCWKMEEERKKIAAIVAENGSVPLEDVFPLWALEDVIEDIDDELNRRAGV